MGTPGFLQTYRVIEEFLNEYYRRFGSKIVKYEICYRSLADKPINKKAILTISVWMKNVSEPMTIKHWYFVEDHWEMT